MPLYFACAQSVEHMCIWACTEWTYLLRSAVADREAYT